MLDQKMKQMAVTIASVAVVAAGASRVNAHHGWSEYDNKQTLNLTGEIQAIGYDNPHATIELRTAEDQVWQVVLAPPSRLQSRGLPSDELQVGETVSLVGYPHRSEDNELRAERIVVDEKTVELR